MPKGRVTFDTVRKIGLALPGVEEGTSYGKPALKVGGKAFVGIPSHKSVEPNSLGVLVDLEQRAEMLAADPRTYYVTDHYIDYPSVLVRLDRLDTSMLRDLVGNGAPVRDRQRDAKTPGSKEREFQSHLSGYEVRKIALEMPDVEEAISWGSPALKAGGKMFACIPTNKAAEPDSLLLRVDLERRAELIEADPATYYVKRSLPGVSVGAGADVACDSGCAPGLVGHGPAVRASKAGKERGEMMESITKRKLAPQPVLVMRRRIKPAEIAQALGEMFQQVFTYAGRNGIAPMGAPMARYLECAPDAWTVEAGVPVAAGTAAPASGDVFLETLPGGFAATTTHVGPYDKLMETHSAVERWIKAEGSAIGGAVWESYITDPGNHPDPKDWKTEVFVPLASD